ncbi:hypothetical protein C8J35_10522 [Rhizobium sp. PP-F2F-G38]|uniref:Uncharacterized protein n=1 Tax=Ferranicluibacter rubi TaxID=2715133 RepID=A0AA43ZEB1_9HYPH|nr:hypothetical protein [Ferranicluibacter rubi]PYE32866.1 hypothetical protein C8J37_10622 [Rhizobium sp. PP-WC-1G-195]PYE42310.1 hypothetical protein DFI02_107174 [Rhizobium sp. PP-F2F-G20b]PYE96916.1 hypothetical protein C8J35_10522 [Rhizobium sp. PP-F2F-G38]TCL93115.1 hypothetical protein C8J38_103304 [Rhizobium sp. PP-WC-2G-219]TCP87915.1 hypothetical protein C8J31_104303 [Rhizobium sp. PP-CC-2G-626]TCQ06697.1 hypothetical protein C8J34_10523 [Rhizobium sp. PP-F2F-G36]TCQ24886.1 hypothe
MTETILLALYTLVALFFLETTFREGEMAQVKGWDILRVAGLLYCMIWPLMVLHVTILAYRDRHAR